MLSWRVSNTLTTDFSITAVSGAITRYGAPEIFNTDQGSQFTSPEKHGIAVSMDGKGCWRDNVFGERLWKSIKYEEVYLRAYIAKAALNPCRFPSTNDASPASTIRSSPCMPAA